MTRRQASLAADIFTGVVVASVGLALAGLTWRLAGARPADTPPPAVGSPAAAAPVDISPILALAPFGRLDAASAQPTSLGLVLRGIILADPLPASLALIAPAGGRPSSYSIGQTLPGGATLEEISLNRVLLRVNGRLERIDLPRVSAGGEAVPAQAAALQPASFGPVVAPSNGLAPQGIAASGSASGADFGPLALLGKLGAAPVGGAYRVGTEPSPEARRAGLLPGDVIERINGLPATAVVSDRQLITQVLAAGPAQIDVLRSGKRISFSFALR